MASLSGKGLPLSKKLGTMKVGRLRIPSGKRRLKRIMRTLWDVLLCHPSVMVGASVALTWKQPLLGLDRKNEVRGDRV